VDEDDVVAGELLPARAGPADELSVVDDKLQIELGRLRAGVARAVRGMLDAPDPAAKAEIALLDESRSIEASTWPSSA
jgi:hypothetical protein